MSNYLFGGEFEFDDKEDFRVFLENVEPNDAFQIIEMGLNHANKKGAFNMVESHCVYKCLEKIKSLKNENTKINPES